MSTVPNGASIQVTAGQNGAEVEIAVSDNGPGIPADQLEHIFERFTRGDAGLTQHVGGTGLGLAISKSLVELHGGAIARRIGARRRARPSGSAAARQRAPSREPRRARRRRLMARVLVADDSETILLLLRTRLEMEGYEVDTAADGEEVIDAMHAASRPDPELLLLDAMMPRKSGIDALRELRAEGVETPALIVSAHQDEATPAPPPSSRSAATSPSRSTSTGCSAASRAWVGGVAGSGRRGAGWASSADIARRGCFRKASSEKRSAGTPSPSPQSAPGTSSR